MLFKITIFGKPRKDYQKTMKRLPKTINCQETTKTIDGKITDFGAVLLWWMQQSMPVKAAPMMNDARAMQTAISAGTPTMTTWDEWSPGDAESSSCWSSVASSPSLTMLRYGYTYRGPRLVNCWATGDKWRETLSAWQLSTGSKH